MAREAFEYDSRSFERYNLSRAEVGRGPIRASTFAALEEAGIYAKDIEGWIEASEVVYAAKLVKASEVADYWRSIAPQWGDHDPKEARPPTGLGAGGTGVPNDPGDYGPSIKVIRDGHNVKVGTDLIPLAIFLEYGTYKMAAFACGARTLEHFGGGRVDSAAKVSDTLFVG